MALEQDPYKALADLADSLGQFWSWMADGQGLRVAHHNPPPGFFQLEIGRPVGKTRVPCYC